MKIVFLLCLTLFSLEAKRIITLSPAVNEIVYALGKGDEVIANTQYCNFPKRTQKLPKVGGYYAISIEKVLALKPTLIILEKNNLALKPKFEKLGLEVLDISTTSLQALENSFARIGQKIDAKEEAKKLITSLKNSLIQTQNILKNRQILIVFGSHLDLRKQVYVSGNHLYFADIIRQSGNQNAYHDKTNKQPALSYEGLIASNPDIIIILAPYAKTQNRSKKSIIKPWLNMPITAAKYKTIYVIDKEYAGIPSDRVRLFIHDFKGTLHDAKDKLPKL